jgi:hypothetical protein
LTERLDDELYKRLVEGSIRRFGSTKKISFLINEKLRKVETGLESSGKIVVEKTFGLWKNWKISSENYVRELRKESEKRLKRLET